MSAAGETLRETIARAYHERWCGRPVSCGLPHMAGRRPRAARRCEGQIGAETLDAIMAAIRTRPNRRGRPR